MAQAPFLPMAPGGDWLSSKLDKLYEVPGTKSFKADTGKFMDYYWRVDYHAGAMPHNYLNNGFVKLLTFG